MGVNSVGYWDQRFKSCDWERNQGRVQSTLFACTAADTLLHHPLMDQIRAATSFHDVGCAEGDGTAVWRTMLGRKRVQTTGSDFSVEAVVSARNRFPDVHFYHVSLQNLGQDYDVTYCSNVLEHFDQPWLTMGYILGRTRKLAIFMVPWMEAPLHDEHNYEFTPLNLQTIVGEFMLVKLDILDVHKPGVYEGKQALLVYSRY